MFGVVHVDVSDFRLGEHVGDAGRIEVSEGLAIGDQVVVRGQNQLVDGAVVSLRDAKGVPAGATSDVGASSEKTAAAEPARP